MGAICKSYSKNFVNYSYFKGNHLKDEDEYTNSNVVGVVVKFQQRENILSELLTSIEEFNGQ